MISLSNTHHLTELYNFVLVIRIFEIKCLVDFQEYSKVNGKLLYNRELNLVLCDNLEGWDGVGGGREVQEGGGIYILMADSHCCMAETNTTL